MAFVYLGHAAFTCLESCPKRASTLCRARAGLVVSIWKMHGETFG